MSVETEALTGDSHHQVLVVVFVNDCPVKLHKRHETGSEIKAAAIAQGVDIKPTFQLILKRPGHHSKVIGDDESITVHDGERFRAIPPDDNS